MAKNKNKGAGQQQQQQSSAATAGAIPELKNYIYSFGSNKAQYDRNNVGIANYCGRTLGKPMQTLVMGTDKLPDKPQAPSTKREDTDGWIALEYDKELTEWIKEKTRYKENKAKVFIIIKGQCTYHMVNKIESDKDYKTLEDNDDVIGLLTMIKELIYNTRSVQYHYWTGTNIIREILTYKQSSSESLIAFYKKWKSGVDMLETQWGPFVPTKLSDKADADVERKRFQACLFLSSLDRKRYGKAIEEMNNAYVAGTNSYPDTVEEVVSRLAFRMDYELKRKLQAEHTVESEEPTGSESSFAQIERETNICYCCGKPGHISPDCPKKDTLPKAEWYSSKVMQQALQHMQDYDSDNDSDNNSTASFRSNTSTRSARSQRRSRQVVPILRPSSYEAEVEHWSGWSG